MVFVFKNLSKPPHRVTAIPVENLEMIKNWLDQTDILFSEGTMNLNWTNILMKIKGDLNEFIEEGGWNFLHEEADEEGEEEQEEDPDSSFHESEYVAVINLIIPFRVIAKKNIQKKMMKTKNQNLKKKN